MIERVARALCLEAGLDPDRKFKSSNWGEETSPHEFAWHEFQPAARAAMEAMRDPTEEMVNAALHWQDHCSDVDSLFEQMIGAAIHGESLPPHPMLKLYTRTESVE